MADFIPTVTAHHFNQEKKLVLETLDDDEQSDLVSVDRESPACTLERKGNLLTDEQKEKLILRDKQ